MEDRFKFRAFYKPAKKMCATFGEGSQEICVFGVNRLFADYLADDSWVIMQSTGLKDKNGKLIFESEIVMTPAGAGFIEWMKGMWIIAWPKGGGTHLHNTKSSDMGIIGNIYENPELLEGSK